MSKIDDSLLSTLLISIALPTILGVFATGLTMWYDFVSTKRRKEELNHSKQVQGALDTSKRIMDEMEVLFSLMKYHAWNIAWRKVRPEGIFPEELIEEDEQQWKEYLKALAKWRSHKIQHRTSLEVYFGKRDTASRLFKLIDATFDKLSFEMWFIYHDNPSNPNVYMQYYVEEIEQQYNSIFNPIMTSIDKEITKEQEENVHRTTSVAFDELQDKIHRLAVEMSDQIRKSNVGNMRKGKNSKDKEKRKSTSKKTK